MEESSEEERKRFSDIMNEGINNLLDSATEEKNPDLSKELETEQKYEKAEIIEETKQKDAYNPAETNVYEANDGPKSQYKATEEFDPSQGYNNNTYF